MTDSERDSMMMILLIVLGILIFRPELLNFTKTDSEPSTVATNHATGPGMV